MCAIRCIAVCVYVDCVSCDLEAGAGREGSIAADIFQSDTACAVE